MTCRKKIFFVRLFCLCPCKYWSFLSDFEIQVTCLKQWRLKSLTKCLWEKKCIPCSFLLNIPIQEFALAVKVLSAKSNIVHKVSTLDEEQGKLWNCIHTQEVALTWIILLLVQFSMRLSEISGSFCKELYLNWYIIKNESNRIRHKRSIWNRLLPEIVRLRQSWVYSKLTLGLVLM